MEKRCVVIKMFGNQDLAGAIKPALTNQEDFVRTEEYKRLANEYKMQKPKIKEYYENKLEEAERKYSHRKENCLQRLFGQGMALIVIFLRACVREVEE